MSVKVSSISTWRVCTSSCLHVKDNRITEVYATYLLEEVPSMSESNVTWPEVISCDCKWHLIGNDVTGLICKHEWFNNGRLICSHQLSQWWYSQPAGASLWRPVLLLRSPWRNWGTALLPSPSSGQNLWHCAGNSFLLQDTTAVAWPIKHHHSS